MGFFMIALFSLKTNAMSTAPGLSCPHQFEAQVEIVEDLSEADHKLAKQSVSLRVVENFRGELPDLVKITWLKFAPITFKETNRYVVHLSDKLHVCWIEELA